MGDSLSIRLTDKLRRDLARVCRRQNRAASDVAREAIRRYIAAEELSELRQRLRPHAAAKGFLTDDDVFKAVS